MKKAKKIVSFNINQHMGAEGGRGFWPFSGGFAIKGVDTDYDKYKDNVTKL